MYIIYVRLQIALLNVICAIRNVANDNREHDKRQPGNLMLNKFQLKLIL